LFDTGSDLSISNANITSNHNVRSRKGNLLGDFFKDLFKYASLRFVQIIRVFYVVVTLLFYALASLKGFVVRRMFWGRSSFYKVAFQVLVGIVTVGAFLVGVNSRISIIGKNETGVVVASGIVGNNDVLYQVGTVNAITETPVSGVDYQVVKYTVKRGDTLSSIARYFGLKSDTIRWANGIPTGKDTLRVGQIISIPPMDGVLYTVVSGDNIDRVLKKVKGANKYDLIELNNLVAPNYALHVGQQLFIPDAVFKPTAALQRSLSGYSTAPTYATKVAKGTFVNPMLPFCGGYQFERGFKKYVHTGVDLSHSPGCWIVAAGSGVVVKAGWCGWDTGYCVAIRHDNGYSTLYLHGLSVGVHVGQRVSAGQPIMRLGSTGKTTGPHLHLSVAPPGVDVYNDVNQRINPSGIVPY
jgi:murein DD-endopeptidase MepM/ murein hydrolase activator NlpD